MSQNGNILNRNNHVILLTNHFPFGRAEAFLESELPYLLKGFTSVTIITKNVTEAPRAEYSGIKVHRVSSKSTLADSLLLPFLVLGYLPQVITYLWSEIRRLPSWRIGVLSKMLHDLGKALIKSRAIDTVIGQNNLTGSIVLYSYWLDSTALSTLFVRNKKAKVVRVSRAHGGDIYESRHPNSYLSFRSVLINELDRIFTISEDGKRHLEKISGVNARSRIEVSRLGTWPQLRRRIEFYKPFVLVSCAYLLPVKRIDLLIEALSMIDTSLTWMHIGDGPLKKSLQEKAAALLSPLEHVKYKFIGAISNKELLQLYSTETIHAFINTSESEGIPVTIMEAQSFGIPVIAPAVGGIPEIISSTKGLLFEKEASPKQLATYIDSFFRLTPGEYSQMSDNSFQNWQDRYNAEKNFPTFVDKLLSLRQV